MYIEPMRCLCEGKLEYGGDWDVVSWELDTPKLRIKCNTCGVPLVTQNRQTAVDQLALSTQIHLRLTGLANHVTQQTIHTKLCTAFTLEYDRQFDILGLVSATPMRDGYTTIIDGDKNIAAGITVSHDPDHKASEGRVPVLIRVVGLVDADSLPSWHTLLFSGLYIQRQGLPKAALVDYAIAFEAFLDDLLMAELTRHKGEEVAKLLFAKFRSIDERFRKLLPIAIGHSHTEREDIYQAWKRHVQEPRNGIVHGNTLSISEDEATVAYTTIYHALRWLQDLRALDSLSKSQS